MSRLSRFISLGLSLTSLLHAADPLPGHSTHGEAFNEGPRQAATLIPGCGKVSFTITTKKPEAQQFFNQGVGQLHGFWYFEAERSFRQVALLDKECSMAFWGMAMANVNNEVRAKQFVRKAVALKDKASAREKLWISTLETFYKEDKNDKRDKKQRALDFIRDLETIVQDYPDDVEAKAFLVWKTWHANGDAPITSYQAVNALLDQVFATNPEHPAHHYRIHLWDNRKPAQALKSAAQNGQNNPGIAHMWHMPGHTYSKLKRYDDAVWQQEASTRTDHAYMIRNWVHPDQIHNYAHNEEWLVRNFNELGRASAAIGLATSLIRNPQHPANNTLDKDSTSASYGRTRLLETLSKWELWDDLLKVTSGPLFPTVQQTSHEVRRLHSRGLAFFAKADTKALASTIIEIEAVDKKAKAKAAEADKVKSDTKAAAKADIKSDAKKAAPAKEVAKGDAKKADVPKGDVKNGENKKPEPAAIALADLRALQAVLTQDQKAADLITKAKDMAKPLAASLWLKLGDKKKAEELVKNYPQDLAGLAAKAEMQQALSKTDDAKKTFEEVRKLAFALEVELPVKKRLDALAKTFGIKDEWRSQTPKRTDSGTRPPLEPLGPMHWHPPVAPKWEALTLDGKAASSSQFEGKPHVLLFYLGAACTHCMEQVNAFAKAAPDYEKAGIQLCAVTLEPLSLAGRITEQMSTKKLPPFPVLCDPSLAAFKTFRAYDDFEEEALHAAVFIDAKGNLRWIDVSWQPFTNTTFLLNEAKRLISLDQD
jgi:peroxiredoxin